jgi:two-component system cell cycle response regulator DivK
MTSKLILHIEDTRECQQLVRAILTYNGYEIITVESAEEGVALAQTERPDLILMDINLPGMNGLEATRQIRGLPALSAVPIVALTATDEASTIQQAAEAGCSAYLSKPFSPTRLVSTVSQFCQPETVSV